MPSLRCFHLQPSEGLKTSDVGDLALKPGRKNLPVSTTEATPLIRELNQRRAAANAEERRLRLLRKPAKNVLGLYEPKVKPNRPSKKQRTTLSRKSDSKHRPKGSKPKLTSKIVYGTKTSSSFTKPNTYTSTTSIVPAYERTVPVWTSVVGNHRTPNPHTFDYSEYDYGSGATRSDNSNGNWSQTIGCTYGELGLPLAAPDLMATAYNQALGRLYEQIRGDVDLSIDLAEMHKTQSMMKQTLKGMSNLALTFRKMKRSNPRDWGNLWLEFTYGWKPLASTIYGGLKRALTQDPSTVRWLRSSAMERFEFATVDRTTTSGGYTQTTRKTYGFNGVKIKAFYNVQGDRLDQLAGFTSLNPVSIAWELTPYSFVVDWFVDVGGYLRNYENSVLYGSSFGGGYYSQLRVEQLQEIYSAAANTSSGSSYSNKRGGVRHVKFERKILSASPKPMLPQWNPHLGPYRLVSGAALLGQMLHSLKHPEDPIAKKSWNLFGDVFNANLPGDRVITFNRRGKR